MTLDEGAPGRLKRQVLRDDVQKMLLEMLVGDQLQPGASLSIDGLSRQLGVSPTPIREALVSLEHSGLVARVALKGYRVAPRLTSEEMSHLFEARLVIELAALSRATSAAGFISQLREAHAAHLQAASEMVRSINGGSLPRPQATRAYFDADFAFHMVLIEAGGNPFLGQMLEGLGAHLHRMVQSVGRGVLDWQVAISEHGAVLSAVESGDLELAVAELREHLLGVQRRSLRDLEVSD